MSTIEVKVPDIGDFKDIPVIEVLVKAGDSVKAEDSLITLESDKATMEVPAPAAGVVKDLRVKIGDKVSEGSLILTLDTAAAGEAKPPRRHRRLHRPRRRRLRAATGRRPPLRQPPRRHPRLPPRPSPAMPAAPSTTKHSRARMHRRRCASSRASWASTWRRSRAPARRAASCTKTSRTSSSRR